MSSLTPFDHFRNGDSMCIKKQDVVWYNKCDFCPIADMRMDFAHIYISGPMSNRTGCNRETFISIENFIKRNFGEKIKITNPAHVPQDISWEEQMKIDLDVLENGNVTHMVMLDYWHTSKGAKMEVDLAIRKNITLISQAQLFDLACCQVK